jgi:hypothetical protein
MSRQNLYTQPFVDALAPDAIIFIDQGDGRKRTIKLKSIDQASGQVSDVAVDMMLFVSSITVSKGIERVPSEASITLRSPRHMMYNIFGSLKDSLSTMQEIEIYMKGRFLTKTGDPQYYPVFWGIISNVSESEPAGDLITVNISCQDMMRWLAITKVNIQPAIANSAIISDQTGNVSIGQANPTAGAVHPWGSFFINISTPGIIMSLFDLSTSAGFIKPQGMSDRSIVVDAAPTETIENAAVAESHLISMWEKKFSVLSTALFIYGFDNLSAETTTTSNIHDVILDLNDYNYIYGYETIITNPSSSPSTSNTSEFGPVQPSLVNVPLLDISQMFPFDAVAFGAQSPPVFVSNFQNRLDIAIEAKNQSQLEFYQDTDGTIVLKPQFYNMDTRQNKIYVIEDLDILNFNEIEDESQVITRVDVTGTYANGMPSQSAEDGNPNYGFAIDYDKMYKYGLRVTSVTSNFLTSPDAAAKYAQRELVKRNSLLNNGSLNIQGRPEMKLGYPIYLPTKDMFCYVTGIDHSFTFGGSFDTTLTVTAFRKKRTDNVGNVLKNLLVKTNGTAPVQSSSQGKNFNYNADDPLKNITKLCDPNSVAGSSAQRPQYRYKTLDDLLKFQGTFTYVKNTEVANYDGIHQQVTDNEGYELIGIGYPFGKKLVLTEDYKIVANQGQQDEIAISALSMTLGSNNTPTLSFQQPLTLNQIQDAEVVRSMSTVADTILRMQPTNNATSTTANNLQNGQSLVPNIVSN